MRTIEDGAPQPYLLRPTVMETPQPGGHDREVAQHMAQHCLNNIETFNKLAPSPPSSRIPLGSPFYVVYYPANFLYMSLFLCFQVSSLFFFSCPFRFEFVLIRFWTRCHLKQRLFGERGPFTKARIYCLKCCFSNSFSFLLLLSVVLFLFQLYLFRVIFAFFSGNR